MIVAAGESQPPEHGSTRVAALIHFLQREFQVVLEGIGVREQLEAPSVFLELVEDGEQSCITRVGATGGGALTSSDRDGRQLDREVVQVDAHSGRAVAGDDELRVERRVADLAHTEHVRPRDDVWKYKCTGRVRKSFVRRGDETDD